MVAHTRKKCAHQLHRRPCVTISRGWSKGLQHYPLMVSNANSSNRSSIRGGSHAKEVCPPTAPQTWRCDQQRRSKGLQHHPLMVSNAKSSNRSSIHGGTHPKEVCPPTAPQTLRREQQRRIQRLAAPSTDGPQRQIIHGGAHAKEVCPPTAPQTLRRDQQRRSKGLQHHLLMVCNAKSSNHPSVMGHARKKCSHPMHCRPCLAVIGGSSNRLRKIKPLEVRSTDARPCQLIQPIIIIRWITRERGRLSANNEPHSSDVSPTQSIQHTTESR